jgi:L-threonylcarbamoyladenylate synthase
MAAIDEIEAAAERLRAGKLVAFPTETVYGLGADATNHDAVAGVFGAKGRPSTNPLIVHVSSSAMAREHAVAPGAWCARAEALARAFWPGPLTLVLPRRSTLPTIVTAGLDHVAVRCPDHPTALALLYTLGRPIVGPSANPSGRVSPTLAAHVREHFDPDLVMVLDGGACEAGIESTVVSLVGPVARVLRRGVVSAAEISAALGEPVDDPSPTHADSSAPLSSPGQLHTHYAPRTRAVLVDDAVDSPEFETLDDEGGRCVVLSHHLATTIDPPHALVRLPGMAGPYAQQLYAALRRADDLAQSGGYALILVERPPLSAETERDTGIWLAIADRLARATS